jgi:hypothetical protein
MVRGPGGLSQGRDPGGGGALTPCRAAGPWHQPYAGTRRPPRLDLLAVSSSARQVRPAGRAQAGWRRCQAQGQPRPDRTLSWIARPILRAGGRAEMRATRPWVRAIVRVVAFGSLMLLTATAIEAAGEKGAARKDSPVELPQPLTREVIRGLVARLSDAEVRELLLAQLDKVAAPAESVRPRRWRRDSWGKCTALAASSARCCEPRPVCPPRWATRCAGSPRAAPPTSCSS